MSTIELLNTISTQFSVCFGFIILIAGVVGNIFDILVFLSLKTFRENSCAFYLTAMAFVNIGQLISSLFPRLMNLWFAIDWSVVSLVYCKIRTYFFQVCSLISFTCMCLATIDQFLSTSSTPHWQRLSSIKTARRLLIIGIVIWILHGIPTLIYHNHVISFVTGNYSCAISNRIFQDYYTYGFVLGLVSCLPVVITAVFSLLAYHSITKLAYRTVPLVRRELDKQLTVMVLSQVLFNVCVLVPYIIVNTINLGVTIERTSFPYAQLQLARNITIAWYYLYYAVRIDHCVMKSINELFLF